jgi:hypothetical protein
MLGLKTALQVPHIQQYDLPYIWWQATQPKNKKTAVLIPLYNGFWRIYMFYPHHSTWHDEVTASAPELPNILQSQKIDQSVWEEDPTIPLCLPKKIITINITKKSSTAALMAHYITPTI